MEPEQEPDEYSSQPHQQQKRSRVLLSCAPCRQSKLKCDREQPCSQCAKKGRLDLCVYAPKPEKKKRRPKGMAARLKRLEGMVRDMMDSEGDIPADFEQQVRELREASGPSHHLDGQVVGSRDRTSYVGATHCLAMLEDIEDLKFYFEDPENGESEGASPDGDMDPSELLMYPHGVPKSRGELLAHLPTRQIRDRLTSRFFEASSPSIYILHRPTFSRKYAKFAQNPSSVSLHWIAQLFMLLSLGLYYNQYQSPAEVQGDSDEPVEDRIRHFRECAGWALVMGRYTQPTDETIAAFLLYIESHIVLNRAQQMSSYMLTGSCIRLMLKMGYHRDASKLVNITPFEGEMRRRQWAMGFQLETLVSFHMGLPGMAQGIESDTMLPLNLRDEDISEGWVERPAGRPPSEFTSSTYPIYKTLILRVFAQIARQAHSLMPPNYSEVMRLDGLLQEAWGKAPDILHVRPLDECIGEQPVLLIQRFGLASLYNKSRCVLHRRYLAEAVPAAEHDYSRQQCLEAALQLLDFQVAIAEACKPGNALCQCAWFVTSLSVHDYILAAMVIYLAIQSGHYPGEDASRWWVQSERAMPTKDELKEILKRSHRIWSDTASNAMEERRTTHTLALMLAKLGVAVEDLSNGSAVPLDPALGGLSSVSSMGSASVARGPSADALGSLPDPSMLAMTSSSSGSGQTPYSMPYGADGTANTMGFADPDVSMQGLMTLGPDWMQLGDGNSWDFLDMNLAPATDKSNVDGDPRAGDWPMSFNEMSMLGTLASWRNTNAQG